MVENPNKGLQVPENYLEVFTESPTTKPEVPGLTQAEIVKSYFTKANAKQMQSKACFAEHGTSVFWPLLVAQLQNTNSHLINILGPDQPFCVALQEWVAFFRNGMAKVCKGFWVLPYWDFSLDISFLLIYDKGNWNLHSWKKWHDRMQKCRAK